MKQTLNMRWQLAINLRYCYSARKAHKTCRRAAVCPAL